MSSHSDPAIDSARVVHERFVEIVDTPDLPPTLRIPLFNSESAGEESMFRFVETNWPGHSLEIGVQIRHVQDLGVLQSFLFRCWRSVMFLDEPIPL